MAGTRRPFSSSRSFGSRGARGPRSPRQRDGRSRRLVLLLVLTALSLLVLDLPATRPLKPVRNVLASIFRPVGSVGSAVFSPLGDAWRGAWDLDDIESERDQLAARLDEVASQDAEIERLRSENAMLLELQGVDTDEAETRLAEVTSRSPSNFDQSVEIDLGSADGVEVGMAVLTGVTEGTGGGLFGRVSQVRTNSATVALITTASFRAGAYIAATGSEAEATSTSEPQGGDQQSEATEGSEPTAGTVPTEDEEPAGSDDQSQPAAPEIVQLRGVLAGRGPNDGLIIEGLQPDAPVAEGDWVYTLGGDSRFPAGMVIGTVSSVRRGDLSTSVSVKPLADLSGRYVKVVYKAAPP